MLINFGVSLTYYRYETSKEVDMHFPMTMNQFIGDLFTGSINKAYVLFLQENIPVKQGPHKPVLKNIEQNVLDALNKNRYTRFRHCAPPPPQYYFVWKYNRKKYLIQILLIS